MPTLRTPGTGWVRRLSLLLLAVGTGAACGASRPPTTGAPQPIPYADTLPIHEPEAREAVERGRILDAPLMEEMASVFSLRRWTGPHREALNVTAFDDVVSSAWWERRSGYEALSPAEVARGPAGSPPEPEGPLTVTGPKLEGRAPGFRIRDQRGRRYLLKFDPAGYPHMSSAAEVIASRLFWAAGYHVPDDHVVFVDSARLELAADARVPGGEDGPRPMRRRDLRDELTRAARLPEGRFIAVASRIVPGVPKGPFFFEGRRSDDPNDHYPHQHRRELRGLRVVSAWLNHREVRPSNTLDSYVPPGYLRHHLIDFSSALGSGTTRPLTPREQRAASVEPGPILGRLFSLGFYRPAWETDTVSVIDPSIGWLPVENFSPDGWTPAEPNAAFRKLTDRDGYWAAKIVGSFSDADLRAVVREGRIPRASARDTLVDILAHRRDATVAYWYARVSPVESPEARPREDGPGWTLRFVDAGLRDGPWTARETRYRWTLVDRETGREWRGDGAARQGSALQELSVHPGSEAPGTRAPWPAAGMPLTLRVEIRRGDRWLPPAQIFLRPEEDGDGIRVAGLRH